MTFVIVAPTGFPKEPCEKGLIMVNPQSIGLKVFHYSGHRLYWNDDVITVHGNSCRESLQ